MYAEFKGHRGEGVHEGSDERGGPRSGAAGDEGDLGDRGPELDEEADVGVGLGTAAEDN